MYLSPKDYAAKWNISVDTVRRAIRAGRLKAYRIGRLIRIEADAVIENTEEEHAYVPQMTVKERLRGILG